MTDVDDDRLERVRGHLEDSVTALADTYDPRSSAAKDASGRERWDGLYVQLVRFADAGSGNADSSAGGKPGSSPPPGFRSDISALISSIDQACIVWRPGGRTTLDRLRNLPYVTDDADVATRAQVLGGFVARATLAIGYRKPSLDLPDVVCRKRHYTRSGWREIGCGRASLKVREGGETVWCSTPECHDGIENPDCTQDEAGAWSCRDSDGDRTHAVTFSKSEWLNLWSTMQGDDEPEPADPNTLPSR